MKKVKIQNLLRKAEDEWADKGLGTADIDLATRLETVEEQLANAKKVKDLAQNLVTKLAKEQESKIALTNFLRKLQTQKPSVVKRQGSEGQNKRYQCRIRGSITTKAQRRRGTGEGNSAIGTGRKGGGERCSK
jgi:hypothetical protein